MGVEAVKYVFLIPLALLGSTAAFAQPSIQLGPGGVQIDPGGPRPGPREERIVRQEDGCQVTIIRRIDEYGRRTTRRVRECDEDEEEGAKPYRSRDSGAVRRERRPTPLVSGTG